MDFFLEKKAVEVTKGNEKYKLFRYYAPSQGPRPESYRWIIFLIYCNVYFLTGNGNIYHFFQSPYFPLFKLVNDRIAVRPQLYIYIHIYIKHYSSFNMLLNDLFYFFISGKTLKPPKLLMKMNRKRCWLKSNLRQNRDGTSRPGGL